MSLRRLTLYEFLLVSRVMSRSLGRPLVADPACPNRDKNRPRRLHCPTLCPFSVRRTLPSFTSIFHSALALGILILAETNGRLRHVT